MIWGLLKFSEGSMEIQQPLGGGFSSMHSPDDSSRRGAGLGGQLKVMLSTCQLSLWVERTLTPRMQLLT